MIEIKNEQLFGKVIAEALSAAQTNPSISAGMRGRWINAVNTAVAKLGDLSYRMHWMAEGGHLLIWSDSNEIYEANGACRCKAFERGQPCWHRALAKLIKNYLAALDSVPPVATGAAFQSEPIASHNNAPYLKTGSNNAPVKIGNYTI